MNPNSLRKILNWKRESPPLVPPEAEYYCPDVEEDEELLITQGPVGRNYQV